MQFKKLSVLFILVLLSSFPLLAQSNADGMEAKRFNYTQLAEVPPRVPGQHPEEGKLPYNAPCVDCVEDISARKVDYRLFRGTGSDAGLVYSQSGYGAIHIDKNGEWISIDPRLRAIAPGKYGAPDQYFPTEIDFINKYSAIKNPSGTFVYNRKLQLWHVFNGQESLLADADYSNYTAGADGAYVQNIFPGIDLEMRVGMGNIKTNFIVKERPTLESGKWIIRDETLLPSGWKMQVEDGNIEVLNGNNEVEFTIDRAFGYDNSERLNGVQLFDYSIDGSVLDLEISLADISAAGMVYPYIIDPLVNSAASLPQASITGSGYGASCFTGYCSYNLNVPTPPNAVLVNVLWSFNYIATGLCWLDEGAVTFHTGSCISPNQAGYYWFCNTIGGGTCTGSNISIFNHFNSCLPGPSCTSQNLNVQMRFYRCYSSGAGCSNACIASGSPWTMTIVGRTVEPTTITANGAASATVCSGAPVVLNANGAYGVPPYTYTWNPGNVNGNPVTVNPTSSGAYTVTITDACGITATQSVNVNVLPGPTPPVLSSNGPLCVGQTLNLTSNVGGNIHWSGPNGFSSTLQNPVITNVGIAASGTYSAYIIGANGCTSTVSTVNVVVNAIPAAPVLGSNSPVCVGQTINLTSNSAGMQWSGPNGFSSTLQNPTLASATAAMAGVYSGYSVVNGCTSATSTHSVVVNPQPVAPTISSNSPICSGQTLNLTSNAASGVQWSGPNSFSSAVQNPSIPNATTAASGTYSAFVALAGCTSATATINVVVNATPTAPVLGSNSPVCTGQALNLTSGTASGMVWSGPNSFSSTLQNPTISSATAAASGTYSAYVVSNGCTSATSTVNVVVNNTPATPVLSSNGPLCSGQTLNLTSNTATGMQWSGPNGFTATTQNPSIPNVTTAASGTYSAYVATAGCTSATATVNVVVNATPTAPTLGSNSPLCAGQTLNLTSNAVGTVWSGPSAYSSTQQNPSIGNVATTNGGTYSAYVVANGCTSQTSTVNVVVNPVPAAPTLTSNTPLCSGDDLNLTSNYASGMQWTGPNGFSSTLQNPVISPANTSHTGTYTAYNVALGCTSANSTVQVNVYPIPPTPVATANGPLCAGETLQLNSNMSSGNNWWGPNGFTSTMQQPGFANVGVNAAGTYSLVIIQNGCSSAVSTVDVTILAAPAAPVLSSNSPVCEGETLELFSDQSLGLYWLGPNMWVSTDQNPQISPSNTSHSGAYSAVVYNGICTSAVAQINVVVNPIPPTPVLTPQLEVCIGSDLQLNAPSGANYQYYWSGPNGFSSNQQNPSFPVTDISASGIYNLLIVANGCSSQIASTNVTVLSGVSDLVTGAVCNGEIFTHNGISYATPGTYTQVYPGSNGCDSTIYIQVNQLPSPIAGFLVPSSVSALNPTVTLNDNSINGMEVYYNWAGGTVNGNNPTITFPGAGLYEITQYVQNGSCFDSTVRTVNVVAESYVFIPNAFTPGKDNLNDSFKPIIPLVEQFTMYIFNRWGEMIYKSDNIYEGWNGGFQNSPDKLVESGVYVYKISYKALEGKWQEVYGHVTLIR